ncbi:MAG: PEP-CTERM sorting domain-containing protein, partial [Acidibrevibacterium sp.]|uniref:PEP-CTERM sorting domain-containing protein n=1 Tax=Acidibrevibacterium sp. TaxID=2606776 RepID=UPI003D057C35
SNIGEMLAVTSSPGGYAGVEITGANGGTLLTNTSGATEDLTLGFEVQSAPGNISGIGLAVGGGTGTATVSETVIDYNTGAALANISGQGLNSTTTLTLSSADNNIYITKDIAVSPSSSLLSVTQYFYDVPGPTNTVPEPATIGLFCLGLGALFFARRARAA